MNLLNPTFYATDADGEPLAGGKVLSYLPGTLILTPLFTNAACTVAATNPVVLNASGWAILFSNRVVDLVLTDANNVAIWGPVTYDQSGGGGGGTRTLTPVTVACTAGAAQIAVPVTLPAGGARIEGVLTRNVTTLGTSQGLTAYAIGYWTVMDQWGQQDDLTAGAVTTMADFGSETRPILSSLTVLLASLSGLFDGVGQIEVTVMISTLA